MEGKFILVASKQFIKLKGNLDKSFKGAVTTYSSIIKTKALERVDGAKAKAENKTVGFLKDVCNTRFDDLNRLINKLIAKLKAMVAIINSILKVLDKLQKFIQTLRKIIIAIQILVKLLVLLPIPTAFATLGITNKSSQLLINIDLKLTGFLFIVTGIDIVITTIRLLLKPLSDQILQFINLLRLLVDELLNCKDLNKNKLGEDLEFAVDDLEDSLFGLNEGMDLNGVDLIGKGDDSSLDIGLDGGEGYDTGGNGNSLGFGNGDGGGGFGGRFGRNGGNEGNGVSNRNTTGNEGGLTNSLNEFGVYKGYRFEIVNEKVVDSSIKIKRRQAIAINKNGIASIQGTPSYANDNQVLINELKLIIDKEEIGSTTVDSNGKTLNSTGGNISSIFNLKNTNVLLGNTNSNNLNSRNGSNISSNSSEGLSNPDGLSSFTSNNTLSTPTSRSGSTSGGTPKDITNLLKGEGNSLNIGNSNLTRDGNAVTNVENSFITDNITNEEDEIKNIIEEFELESVGEAFDKHDLSIQVIEDFILGDPLELDNKIDGLDDLDADALDSLKNKRQARKEARKAKRKARKEKRENRKEARKEKKEDRKEERKEKREERREKRKQRRGKE